MPRARARTRTPVGHRMLMQMLRSRLIKDYNYNNRCDSIMCTCGAIASFQAKKWFPKSHPTYFYSHILLDEIEP